MLETGPSACALVAVTAAVDTGATGEGVGSGVVCTRGWVGRLAASATGWAVRAWVVRPCARGLTAGVGLAVEWLGVCLAGL